jgi:hypothetical protein
LALTGSLNHHKSKKGNMDFDTSVKLSIYQMVANTTRLPSATQVADELEVPVGEVLASFSRLHQKRLVVPEPEDPTRLRMAPPFSGIETPFHVSIKGKVFFANCAWDALGIPAALHQNATVDASDGYSREAIQIQVTESGPLAEPCVIHFAVPAAHWWQDIVYT